MSSRCRSEAGRRPRLLLAAAALALGGAARTDAGAPALRVCADPDNLPYSHRDGSGYENRLAAWLAEELHRPLHVAWVPLLPPETLAQEGLR